jgi:hypothetical protein
MLCFEANILSDFFQKRNILKDAVFLYALNILQLSKATNKFVKLLIYPGTKYIDPEVPKPGSDRR